MDSSFLLGMIGSLIFSIVLSGIEVAFLSCNKGQIELRAQKGSLGGKIMAFFFKKPTWFIGTTLIGNIASLILFGIFATLALLSWYEGGSAPLGISSLIPITLLTFCVSIVILYTVEFASKSFFRHQFQQDDQNTRSAFFRHICSSFSHRVYRYFSRKIHHQ